MTKFSICPNLLSTHLTFQSQSFEKQLGCEAHHQELRQQSNLLSISGISLSIKFWSTKNNIAKANVLCIVCPWIRKCLSFECDGCAFIYWWLLKKLHSTLGKTQPLGKNLSFLEDPRTFEGRGSARGLRRFRKAHLENILPRGSWDRDPRYPTGVPRDQKNILKNFLMKSY